MNKSKKLKDAYLNWLDSGFIYKDLDSNLISISTPFIDADFDNIDLYAEIINDNKIIISDGGDTIFNLEAHGVIINNRTKTRKNLLNTILSDFGVSLNDQTKELSILTNLSKFGKSKNRILQAIFRINDLAYLSNNKVANSFNDLIGNLLIENDITYTPSITIASQSSDLHFDFCIPNNKLGESLIQTSARPYDINQAKVFNYDASRVFSTKRNINKITLLVNDKDKSNSDKLQDIRNTATNELSNEKIFVTPYSEIKDNPQLLQPSKAH